MPERTKWNLIDLSSGGEALSLFLLATLHRHLRSSSLASATLTLVHKVSIGCQQEPILETNYMNTCYFENLTDYKL